MAGAPLWVVRAGTVAYDEAVILQQRIHQGVHEGRLPDVLLLLQHPPVITLGRGARSEHLLAGPDTLARCGVEVRETARGGDVTYHGPGQLVGYPILSLDRHGRDVHRYVRNVEESLIRALATFGVEGSRIPGLTGVWVGNEKVAAIGIGIRRWVTWHGFALNVEARSLDGFQRIVPCGIRGRGVTALELLLGHPVDLETAGRAVVEGFAGVFGVEPEGRSLPALERSLSTPEESAAGAPPAR